MARQMHDGFEERRKEYEERILEWLAGEDIRKYKGMSRADIISATGGYKRYPVAELPIDAVRYFGVDDPRVYSNRGYFIDHAVNRHGDLSVGDYLAMLDTFTSCSPDSDILIDDDSKTKALIFINKIDDHWFKGVAELDSNTQQIVPYMTYFKTGKKPDTCLKSLK